MLEMRSDQLLVLQHLVANIISLYIRSERVDRKETTRAILTPPEQTQCSHNLSAVNPTQQMLEY